MKRQTQREKVGKMMNSVIYDFKGECQGYYVIKIKSTGLTNPCPINTPVQVVSWSVTQ